MIFFFCKKVVKRIISVNKYATHTQHTHTQKLQLIEYAKSRSSYYIVCIFFFSSNDTRLYI